MPKKLFKICSASLFIFFGYAFQAEAKNLYVNQSTGNDAATYAQNDESHPWATIGRAAWGSTNRTAPNTFEAARAGDRVYVTAGTFNASASSNNRSEPAFNPANSGTAGNPISFEGIGTVVLRSTNGIGPVIGSSNRNYIQWKNFYIDEANVNTQSDTGPVVLWSANNCVLDDIEIKGKKASWVDNHNGIRLEYANNCTVKNCKIYGLRDGQSAGSDAGENVTGIMTYDSAHNIFEHNEIFDVGNGIFIKGIHSVNQTGNIIRYNLFHDAGINGGGGVELTGADSTRVYQNVFRDCRSGIWMWAINDQNHDNWIVNNTFIRTGERGVIFFKGNDANGYDGGRFYNNITHTSSHIVHDVPWGRTPSNGSPSNVIHEHNNYYGFTAASFWYSENAASKSFVTWKTDTGYDTANPASITTDPLLVNVANNDFRLCTGLGTPAAGCTGISSAMTLGLDILDLDGDGNINDTVPAGAYITGNEAIGLSDENGQLDLFPPAVPMGLGVR